MPRDCECSICRHRFDFPVDRFLLEEMDSKNCVIFAGSGVSTERVGAHQSKLWESLQRELSCQGLTFPELVSRFESKPDGRFKFIQLVKERFDYIDGFAELRDVATEFHRELATMPYLERIVTTNWDRYFEDYCAAKPFVYPGEMRFWDASGRSVLKVHGSIDNYETIVASEADYENNMEKLRNGVIGAKLKELLATRTCIFVGYSMADWDFREIFSFIRSEMKEFSKPHYYVSPFADEESFPDNWDKIVKIKTDGAYFLKSIKAHMVENACYAHDSIYEFCDDLLEHYVEEHVKICEVIDPHKKPQVIINLAYQDGAIHLLKRVRDSYSAGTYSNLHVLQAKFQAYSDKSRGFVRAKNYWDAAYCRGYGDAAFALFNMYERSQNQEEVLFPPAHFHFRDEYFEDAETYMENVDNLPDAHKSAFRECQKIAPSISGKIVQHTPFV